MTQEMIQSKSTKAPATAGREREVYLKPQYRVKTEEESFELRVVMPGVGKSDVKIALENGRLTITGTPHREVPATWRALHEELPRNPYRLELQLHRDIDEGGIAAKVEDGILSLQLPLKATVKPRVIEVK